MVVRETYQVEPIHAGLVIGKQGKDLRALKEMPGVRNIYFDTNSSSRSYTLQVTGVNSSACKAVYHEVQRRIKSFMRIIPEVSRTFIDVNDRSLDTIELVPFGIGRNESVIPGGRKSRSNQTYIISSFTRGNLRDTFDLSIDDTPDVKPNFMGFLEKNISTSFQEALNNHQGTPNEKLKFHMSPGKIIFLTSTVSTKCHLLCSKITGSNGAEYMKKQGMKTFFTPNLHPKYITLVNKRLADLGFENLNEDCPETYTTVHLDVGPEQIPFSVVLALDKNLETPKVVTDDPRLSEEKRKAIKKILDAITIGEVMDVINSEHVRLKYFKMTRYVHPDKNLHPGATDAFKKLNHAYEEFVKGKIISAKALVVENNVNEDSEKGSAKIPPKVVKVKTKKIRMCVVTTLSAKDLDVRGSLKAYEEDKGKLSDHVRQAINLCWDQRDSSGIIPTPEGQHKITITCVKQVVEAHNWAKEISYVSGGDQTAVLEIKIEKLREKSGMDVNWNDCVEIYLELNCQSTNRNNLSGESLASEMIELKKWVDRIFQ